MRTAVSSAFRLARGATRPQRITLDLLAADTGASLRHLGIRLVSFDIFETLVCRTDPGASRIRSIVAGAAARLATKSSGAAPVRGREAKSLRSAVESELRERLRKAGADPEVSHHDVIRSLMQRIMHSEPSAELVTELVRYELSLEFQFSEYDRTALQVVDRLKLAGHRVIGISDMYIAGRDLDELLVRHGLQLDKVYASSDVHLSKFTGRLFQFVAEREGFRPHEILHVGDNLLADVFSARAANLNAVRWKAKGHSKRATIRVADTPYHLGYNILGPAFVTTAELLLRRAEESAIDHLAFVARDAELLHQVVELRLARVPRTYVPQTRYIYLSRRACAAAGLERLRTDDVTDILAARATNRGLETVAAGLNLDGEQLRRLTIDLGITGFDDAIHAPFTNAHLQQLLSDPNFQTFFREQSFAQRAQLRHYLESQGLIGGTSNVGLVDIGWRGTTQTSLQRAFGGDPAFRLKRGFYMGLWDDGITRPPDDMFTKEGLLCDYRRGRTILEGAAWYLAFVLEAVSRAPHGTVIGYETLESGKVVPRLAPKSISRVAEESDEDRRVLVRTGILDYTKDSSSLIEPLAEDDEPARRTSQRRLARLAFMPNRNELATLGGLTHTEGVAERWQTPLVATSRPGAVFRSEYWLEGLASPWRAGFVRNAGGYPLAAAFMLAESLLLVLPTGVRRTIRNRLQGS